MVSDVSGVTSVQPGRNAPGEHDVGFEEVNDTSFDATGEQNLTVLNDSDDAR